MSDGQVVAVGSPPTFRHQVARAVGSDPASVEWVPSVIAVENMLTEGRPADLVVLTIVAAYRKYYGTAFALRITALMLVTMVIAALIVDGLFSAFGLIPSGARPTRNDIFGSVELDYKLALNVLGLAIFTALLWLTARDRDRASAA